MSDSDPSPVEHSSEPAGTATPADVMLPPVEPPTGRFILQLFVIPALIVTIIVVLWLAIDVLLRRTEPSELIKRLESGGSIHPWQSAQELADVLRDGRHDDFKTDAESAIRLGKVLTNEMARSEKEGGLSENSITMRYFLARALGEFRTPEGMPALLAAADTQHRNEEELHVRRAALEAIALLVANVREFNPSATLDEASIESALVPLSAAPEDLIRSEAAFALGVLATPGATERLKELLDDSYADTRYNAATALARNEDLAALDVLLEMIDLEEDAGIRTEKRTEFRFRAQKRAAIFANAIRSLRLLADAHPDHDFSEAKELLQTITAANKQQLKDAFFDPSMVSVAQRMLDHLQD